MPAVTLTWHACKYKVHKLHQKGEKARAAYPLGGEGGGTDGEECGLGLAGNALPCRKQNNSNSTAILCYRKQQHGFYTSSCSWWRKLLPYYSLRHCAKPSFFQKHYQILPVLIFLLTSPLKCCLTFVLSFMITTHSFMPPLPIQHCVCVVCKSSKCYIYASSMWPAWCRRCLSLLIT